MKRREFLLASSAGLAGSVLPGISSAASTPCMQPTLSVDSGTSSTTSCSPSTLEADWQARISGAGVVWYHDFRSDNEVNAFRWSAGYNGGNDPAAQGGDATLCRRITTDGITGACLEIVRPTGSSDGSVWWRPFSPIQGGTTTGNGRGAGANDPGAGGTISAKAYAATDGGGQIAGWGDKGYYANARYSATNSTIFDGSDYYLQARVKMDPARIATAKNRAVDAGKLFYFSRTDRSLTPQEIVVESYGVGGDTTKDYFQMYRSGGPPLYGDSNAGDQPGSSLGSCSLDTGSNCWAWPLGQWVTVLWHIAPGTASSLDGTSSNKDTLVQVWIAMPGQTTYTKIWDQPTVALPFDTQWGHNALICSAYQNGTSMDQFYQRWCQIIFSKQTIPCPQV